MILGQPEFLERLAERLRSERLSAWRSYLRWHLLHSLAPYLDERCEAADFDFYHRRLLGQREPQPRWRRATTVVDQLMGESLGAAFVEEHFPPTSRARMQSLVEDLRAVFTDRLARLEWMTAETRSKALAKFARFEARIGHPDRFRDYSALPIDRTDFVGNVRRGAQFEDRRTISEIGTPVDREEWDMTPPTVNAYFDPSRNEIFFPAGILQPPFFDPDADEAVNYGGIGTVIGHEITHGYDDQGRRFDAEGNLVDWWGEEDAAEFQRRAAVLVAEYSAEEPLPGVHVNGALTLGENIADFGGVSVAFEALQRRLAREPSLRRNIDGLTPEQRFCISFAQVWRSSCREEELRRRLMVDPHSPPQYPCHDPPPTSGRVRSRVPRAGGRPTGARPQTGHDLVGPVRPGAPGNWSNRVEDRRVLGLAATKERAKRYVDPDSFEGSATEVARRLGVSRRSVFYRRKHSVRQLTRPRTISI